MPQNGVLTVRDALLRPTRPGERGVFAQVCGVFSADGVPVPAAQTITRAGRLCLPCSAPESGPGTAPPPRRKGRWLFGGVGFHHFGHALIYSTARLWALDHLADPLEGVVYFDRGTGGRTRPGTTRNLQALLGLLGIDLPVVTIAEDEVVDELLVPEQGISTATDLFDGLPAYRHFIRSRIVRAATGDIATARHPAVYVSRSGLGLHREGLLFEDEIERLLSAAGYHIFHPQRASLVEQIATYRGVLRLVGVDGSAMHLAGFALQPGARVAVLGRRPFYPAAMASQITQFSGAQTTVINACSQVFIRTEGLQAPNPWFWTHAMPDLPALAESLFAAGMLDAYPNDWHAPSPEAVQARLDKIARRNRSALVPFTG